MTYFSVMIEANNLLIRGAISEAPQIHGCFCTRYVEADDSDSAIFRAKAIVVDELNAEGITCSANQLVVESAEQISGLHDPESSSGKGFTFYLVE